MSLRRAIVLWGALLVATIGIGAGTAFATHRWDCWAYADYAIYWYNGASGTYHDIFEEEAITDTDSWHNYTDIELTSTSSANQFDSINAFNGNYGFTGWLGLAEITSYSGCTIYQGRARLNQSYLDFGYSRTNKEHVACQEVGHLFGLLHNENASDTCMNDTILTAPQPNAHDQELVNSIY
jgi:predicted Zn-dependent protease